MVLTTRLCFSSQLPVHDFLSFLYVFVVVRMISVGIVVIEQVFVDFTRLFSPGERRVF